MNTIDADGHIVEKDTDIRKRLPEPFSKRTGGLLPSDGMDTNMGGTLGGIGKQRSANAAQGHGQGRHRRFGAVSDQQFCRQQHGRARLRRRLRARLQRFHRRSVPAKPALEGRRVGAAAGSKSGGGGSQPRRHQVGSRVHRRRDSRHEGASGLANLLAALRRTASDSTCRSACTTGAKGRRARFASTVLSSCTPSAGRWKLSFSLPV